MKSGCVIQYKTSQSVLAGLQRFRKKRLRTDNEQSGGQFTWCIVLLVASALSLVAASIVTMQRSIRLSKHLKEIEE